MRRSVIAPGLLIVLGMLMLASWAAVLFVAYMVIG